jgi:hypothetical protein
VILSLTVHTRRPASKAYEIFCVQSDKIQLEETFPSNDGIDTESAVRNLEYRGLESITDVGAAPSEGRLSKCIHIPSSRIGQMLGAIVIEVEIE